MMANGSYIKNVRWSRSQTTWSTSTTTCQDTSKGPFHSATHSYK